MKKTEMYEKYSNGRGCGKELKHEVVQSFEDMSEYTVRVFMLIANINPAVVYYRDGYIKVNNTLIPSNISCEFEKREIE